MIEVVALKHCRKIVRIGVYYNNLLTSVSVEGTTASVEGTSVGTTISVEGTAVSDDGVLENSLFHNLLRNDRRGTCKGNRSEVWTSFKYTSIWG